MYSLKDSFINQPGNDIVHRVPALQGLNATSIWSEALTELYALLGANYEKSIKNLTGLLNNMYGAYYCGWLDGESCYDYDLVERVINSYDNLALQGTIKEYNLETISLEEQQKIEATTAYASGATKERTHKILNALYYNTKDNFTKDIFIYPSTVKKTEGYREINEKLKNESGLEATKEFFGDILNFGSTILNVAVFAGIVIGGIYLVDMLGRTKR